MVPTPSAITAEKRASYTKTVRVCVDLLQLQQIIVYGRWTKTDTCIGVTYAFLRIRDRLQRPSLLLSKTTGKLSSVLCRKTCYELYFVIRIGMHFGCRVDIFRHLKLGHGC